MLTLTIDTTPEKLRQAANALERKSQLVSWGQKRPTVNLIKKDDIRIILMAPNNYCNEVNQ